MWYKRDDCICSQCTGYSWLWVIMENWTTETWTLCISNLYLWYYWTTKGVCLCVSMWMCLSVPVCLNVFICFGTFRSWSCPPLFTCVSVSLSICVCVYFMGWRKKMRNKEILNDKNKRIRKSSGRCLSTTLQTNPIC